MLALTEISENVYLCEFQLQKSSAFAEDFNTTFTISTERDAY